MEQTEPVEIARFLDLRAAEVALSVLTASGIEAYLDQPYTASLYSVVTGGVRLFVRAEDVERATEALQPPEE